MIFFNYFLQYVLASISIILLFSCQSPKEINLEGAWRLDSVYDFYNGFAFMNRKPSPSEVHVYRGDSTVLRRGMGFEKKYFYSLEKINLSIKNKLNSKGSKHIVIKADSTGLILKNILPEIFPGKKQERYEIRFFTRIPMDALK